VRKTSLARAEANPSNPMFAGPDDVAAVFDLEATSALVRRGGPFDRLTTFCRDHLGSRRLVTIGPRAVRAVGATRRVSEEP